MAETIDAHYTNDMKLQPPKVELAQAPPLLPRHQLFSDKEATKKIQQINTDIYVNSKKEKTKHGFNYSAFFKIFGGLSIIAIILACIHKFRK